MRATVSTVRQDRWALARHRYSAARIADQPSGPRVIIMASVSRAAARRHRKGRTTVPGWLAPPSPGDYPSASASAMAVSTSARRAAISASYFAFSASTRSAISSSSRISASRSVEAASSTPRSA